MKKSLLLLTLFLFTAAFSFAEEYTDSEMRIFKTIDTFIHNFPKDDVTVKNVFLSNGFIPYKKQYLDYFDNIEVVSTANLFFSDLASNKINFRFSFATKQDFVKTIQKVVNYFNRKYADMSLFSFIKNDDSAYPHRYIFTMNNGVQIKISYNGLMEQFVVQIIAPNQKSQQN